MPRPKTEPRYAFRSVEQKDLKLLAQWMRQPHLVEWWGDPDQAMDEIRQAMEDIAVEPMMVELDGRPVAYLQSYDPHLEDDHPYADHPFGTLGLDLSIGPPDLVGNGHGSALLRQFIDELFAEGIPRVIIDPHPDNARAVRCYEKAGFRPLAERTTKYGRVLMMLRDNEDWIEP